MSRGRGRKGGGRDGGSYGVNLYHYCCCCVCEWVCLCARVSVLLLRRVRIRTGVLRSPRVVRNYRLPSARRLVSAWLIVRLFWLFWFWFFLLLLLLFFCLSLVLLSVRPPFVSADHPSTRWWTRGAAWQKWSARPRKSYGTPRTTGPPTTGNKSTSSTPNKNTGNWGKVYNGCHCFSCTTLEFRVGPFFTLSMYCLRVCLAINRYYWWYEFFSNIFW